MKILLTAINAKYIHSNLAVYSLKAYAKDPGVEIAEYTINQTVDSILGSLYEKRPDILCFSCYIWNLDYVESLAREFAKICPETEIWLGGPEVSYDAGEVLRRLPKARGVMKGEGEATFAGLCRAYRKGEDKGPEAVMARERELSGLQGITYRTMEGEIRENPWREPLDLSEIPFVYEEMELPAHKILYYESSRGCPFACSYCLSSIDKKLRFRDLDLVKKELQFFIDREVLQVKFVDRTFNYDEERACQIIGFIRENDNGVTNFHFEICADLVSDRMINLLAKARPGLFQLEIGIQSTNPETLRAVDRKENVYPVLYNAERLAGLDNIHVHVDLIAGLPFETYELFKRSFDKVYRLGADAFQLGFLKVLKGTPIAAMKERYGIVARERAPYEIISNMWMSAGQLVRLKTIENMLNIYYNRGGFSRAMEALTDAFGGKPFDLYESLADFYYENGYQHKNRKKEDQYRILRRFIIERTDGPAAADAVTAALEEDLRSALNPEEVKRFLKKGWEI